MKIGLIRCIQTEDMCPGTTCFKVLKDKNWPLKELKKRSNFRI